MIAAAPWQAAFVDRCALLLAEAAGMPPSHARVFAWLVVCEPAEQSAEDLQCALRLSAGAVSMATAALVRSGVVERIAASSSSRRRLHRIDAAGWDRLMQTRRESLAALRATAEQAIAQASPGQARLGEMHALYSWFERSAAGYAAQRATRSA